MNYIIRKATKEDANILDGLLTKLIHDEKNYDKNINNKFIVNNYYINLINNENSCFLVAEIDNKVIGYLYGYILDNQNVCINKGTKIDALFIEEEYRNMGIAKSLIREFKKWTIKINASYIEIAVFTNNTKAYNLYENAGFKTVKSTMQIEIK